MFIKLVQECFQIGLCSTNLKTRLSRCRYRTGKIHITIIKIPINPKIAQLNHVIIKQNPKSYISRTCNSVQLEFLYKTYPSPWDRFRSETNYNAIIESDQPSIGRRYMPSSMLLSADLYQFQHRFALLTLT